MQLAPVLAAVRAQLTGHAALAGGDPHIDAAALQLGETLEPALRSAALDLAQQAATEIAAQLPGHRVSVVLSGDDIELRVDEETANRGTVDEDLDARITLRLPPSLKQTIERFADVDGESVNSWVVDALSKRARRGDRPGQRLDEEFDL